MDNQEKTFWLNYTKNQIDREISRIRNSGITNWALLTLIVVITYGLIDDFSILFQEEQKELALSWLPYFLSTVFMGLFSIYFLLRAIALSLNIGFTRRLLPKTSQNVQNLYVIFALLVLSIFTFTNYVAAVHSNSINYIKFPFFVFMAACLIQMIHPMIRGARRIYYNLYKGFDIPDLYHLMFESRSNKLRQVVINLLWSVFLSIIMIILIRRTTFNVSFQNIALLFRISVELIGLIAVFLVFILRLSAPTEISQFESLEQQIIKDEIDSNGVRSFLDERVFGISLQEWLRRKMGEFQKKYEGYRECLQNTVEELKQIDRLHSEPESVGVQRLRASLMPVKTYLEKLRLTHEQDKFQFAELKWYAGLSETEKEILEKHLIELNEIEKDINKTESEMMKKHGEILDKFKKFYNG